MPGHRGRMIAAAGLLAVASALPARGIEMFTFFGDGSRIGLPSLEVPIEAYPGIPLRSDRIRARAAQARAAQARRGGTAGNAAAPRGSTGPSTGITIRPMPSTTPAPGPAVGPAVGPAGAPAAPPGERPLPGLQQPVFPPRR